MKHTPRHKCPDPQCRSAMQQRGKLGSLYFRCWKCKRKWTADMQLLDSQSPVAGRSSK